MSPKTFKINRFLKIAVILVVILTGILLLISLLFSAIFIASGGVSIDIKDGTVINSEIRDICIHTEPNKGSGEWINIFTYKCDEKINWDKDYISEDEHSIYVYDLISSGECVDVSLQNSIITIKKNPICKLLGVESSEENKFLVEKYGMFVEEKEFLTFKNDPGVIYLGDSEFATEYTIDLPKECEEERQQEDIHIIPKVKVICQINTDQQVSFIINKGGYAAGLLRSESVNITKDIGWNIRYYDNENHKVAYLSHRYSSIEGVIEVYFDPYSKASQQYFQKILSSIKKTNSEFNKR